MKNVLIVDDEQPFLASVRDGLSRHDSRFAVITATNGQEAIEQLEGADVDMVVTDLKMPKVGGFQLLSHIISTRPGLPVVVMTAFGTGSTERQAAEFGAVRLLEKPFDIETLHRAIDDVLFRQAHGDLFGITLPSFAQLVQAERKSCCLRVQASGGREGVLHFKKGRLIQAEAGAASAEAAALDILGWDDTRIEMRVGCRKVQELITASLDFLLMEAYRLRDEASRHDGNEEDELEFDLVDESDSTLDNAAASAATTASAGAPEEGVSTGHGKIDELLLSLQQVNGFRTAGVVDAAGGALLAVRANDYSVDLEPVARTYNEIFLASSAACRKIGLDSAVEMVSRSSDRVVIMRCSGVEAPLHAHVIVVLDAGGNHALARSRLDKLMPSLAALPLNPSVR